MRHFQMKIVLKRKTFCAGPSAANKMKFIQLRRQTVWVGKEKTSGWNFMEIKEHLNNPHLLKILGL